MSEESFNKDIPFEYTGCAEMDVECKGFKFTMSHGDSLRFKGGKPYLVKKENKDK